MKNIKSVLWILIFLCGFFLACEKNNVNPTDDYPDLKKIVIAGKYDTVDFYILCSPTIKVIEKMVVCFFYSGIESIDIDNDGYYDLKFHSMTDKPDINNECCDCPIDTTIICDCSTYGRIYKSIQTTEKKIQIACDLGNYAICFKLNDTIETWKYWISGDWIDLIDKHYFPLPEVIRGNWNTMEDRYLGVRKIDNDTLYGWIKLNLSETIEIKEIYLEKK